MPPAQLSPPSGTATGGCFHIAVFVFNVFTSSHSAAPQRVYRGANQEPAPGGPWPPGPQPGTVHEHYQGPGSGGLNGST